MTRHFVERAMGREQGQLSKKPPAPAGLPPPASVPPDRLESVYDDTEVCRVLGIRRRFLVRARNSSKVYGHVGRHVGMLGRWITAINPTVNLDELTPLKTGKTEECGGRKDGGNVVTVEVKGKFANNQRISCIELTTGRSVIVSVPDAYMFMMGEQFDAVEQFGQLVYAAELNTEPY